MLSILAGDHGILPCQISVDERGATIHVSGGLRAGCARQFARILAATPAARVIDIESSGGRIDEAIWIMRLIREHGLSTCTSARCLSAATLILIGGTDRVADAGAFIGFHDATTAGDTEQQRRWVDDRIRRAMESTGINDDFIDKVIAAI